MGTSGVGCIITRDHGNLLQSHLISVSVSMRPREPSETAIATLTNWQLPHPKQSQDILDGSG